MKKVFWRLKGSHGRWYHGRELERNGEIVMLSDTEFSAGYWYHTDDVDIEAEIDEFGLTNNPKYITEAVAFREAAIADGWSCVPTYGDKESLERHATLKKEGFHCSVMARHNPGKKYEYEVGVSLWGPDKLCIMPPITYDWDAIKAGLRTCGYCGTENVDTQRVGFAGRCCNTCLGVARKTDEYPGWCN